MSIKVASKNYIPYEALEDDKNLLNLILKDSSESPSEYLPTNFWKFHQDQSIDDLINGSVFKICSEQIRKYPNVFRTQMYAVWLRSTDVISSTAVVRTSKTLNM